jgi:UDP-N-acetylglucosamine 2-epimerase (non-hydrolysing)
VTELKNIDIIAGARPNFMKIAPIIRAIEQRKQAGAALDYRLVHTGQHYDQQMSGHFFTQLEIAAPHVNLDVGSGTQAEQTAAIMIGYERLLKVRGCDLCLVVGDVTSTMACAIAAQKLLIPVAHVEGGIRSGDWSMPEEINRRVTDAISNFFFTTSESAGVNLKQAGVNEAQIHFVGNTMIDTLLWSMDKLCKPPFWQAYGLEKGRYLVLTLHRPSNVDDEATLLSWLNAIAQDARDLPVIFPAHPRTRQRLDQMANVPPNIHIVEPQAYFEFNYLVQNAKAVLTDSGGVTEEATVLGVPCLTLRDSTERPETISIGTNELVGTNPEALKPFMMRLMAGEWKKRSIPPLWDGRAGARIAAILETLLL